MGCQIVIFLSWFINMNCKNCIAMEKENKTDSLFYLKQISDYTFYFLHSQINLQDSNQLKHPQLNINLYYCKRR